MVFLWTENILISCLTFFLNLSHKSFHSILPKIKITQKFLPFSSSNCSRPLGLERIGNMQCSTLNNNNSKKEILTTPVWNLSLLIISTFINFHLRNIHFFFFYFQHYNAILSILFNFIYSHPIFIKIFQLYPLLSLSISFTFIHYNPFPSMFISSYLFS